MYCTWAVLPQLCVGDGQIRHKYPKCPILQVVKVVYINPDYLIFLSPVLSFNAWNFGTLFGL